MKDILLMTWKILQYVNSQNKVNKKQWIQFDPTLQDNKWILNVAYVLFLQVR